MTGKLKLLCNKIKMRVVGGEVLTDILTDYPLLTEDEKNIILQEVS